MQACMKLSKPEELYSLEADSYEIQNGRIIMKILTRVTYENTALFAILYKIIYFVSHFMGLMSSDSSHHITGPVHNT